MGDYEHLNCLTTLISLYIETSLRDYETETSGTLPELWIRTPTETV